MFACVYMGLSGPLYTWLLTVLSFYFVVFACQCSGVASFGY